MSRKTAEVRVNPAVLKWARETADYSEELVARRLALPLERVQAWETEAAQACLTVRRLEELAQLDLTQIKAT